MEINFRNWIKEVEICCSQVILLVLGEILTWALNYFGESNESVFLDFTSGLLLGLSVGMKLIGIILIYIVKSREKKWKRRF